LKNGGGEGFVLEKKKKNRVRNDGKAVEGGEKKALGRQFTAL